MQKQIPWARVNNKHNQLNDFLPFFFFFFWLLKEMNKQGNVIIAMMDKMMNK